MRTDLTVAETSKGQSQKYSTKLHREFFGISLAELKTSSATHFQ